MLIHLDIAKLTEFKNTAASQREAIQGQRDMCYDQLLAIKDGFEGEAQIAYIERFTNWHVSLDMRLIVLGQLKDTMTEANNSANIDMKNICQLPTLVEADEGTYTADSGIISVDDTGTVESSISQILDIDSPALSSKVADMETEYASVRYWPAISGGINALQSVIFAQDAKLSHFKESYSTVVETIYTHDTQIKALLDAITTGDLENYEKAMQSINALNNVLLDAAENLNDARIGTKLDEVREVLSKMYAHLDLSDADSIRKLAEGIVNDLPDNLLRNNTDEVSDLIKLLGKVDWLEFAGKLITFTDLYLSYVDILSNWNPNTNPLLPESYVIDKNAYDNAWNAFKNLVGVIPYIGQVQAILDLLESLPPEVQNAIGAGSIGIAFPGSIPFLPHVLDVLNMGAEEYGMGVFDFMYDTVGDWIDDWYWFMDSQDAAAAEAMGMSKEEYQKYERAFD
jgi:uncharacterized protein YukE